MSQRTEHSAATVAHPSDRERILVPVLAAAVFFSVLNTTMVNVALPTIRSDFDVNAAQVGWLATLYSLVFGIATPFYGRLGDRWGIRRMYLIGMSIFVLSSLLAALSPTFWLLVTFRVGQGLGSAAIPSLGQALITRTVPSIRRGAALGMTMAAVGSGQAIGPAIGGTLTEFISWRAIFLVSCLAVAVLPFLLKLVSNETSDLVEPLDWVGGIALGATIAGFLIALGSVEQNGFVSPVVLGSLGFAVISLIFTIYWQHHQTFPFINRELIGNHRYLILCSIAFLTMGAAVGTLILIPFMLDDVNGLSAAKIGLVMLPQAIVVTLLSRPMGRLSDKYPALDIATAGVLLNLAVILIFVTVAVGWSAIAIAVLLGCFGVGQAMAFPSLGATVTRSIPSRLAGTGMGLYNMLFFVGGAFGVSASTVLLASRELSTTTIMPFYSGNADYSEFSDAFLYSLVASGVTLVLIRIVRKIPEHASAKEEAQP